MKSANQIGILWMILHCFLISAMSAMIRNISDNIHVFEVVFLQNIIAFILISIFILLQKNKTSLKTKKLNLHIYRALLGTISLAMYFHAFTVIPLTQARGIALTGPLISSLFAVFFLKEKIGWHRTSALIIGFLGALLIIQPTSSNFSYASLLVIGAVFMWSIIDLIIKIMGRTESTTTQIFYLTGLIALFSLPGAIFYWETPRSYQDWLWINAIGAIFLINSIAVFNAYKNAEITAVMPFDFSGMIFTALIAYFAFSEIINLPTAIGSIIIVLSSLYAAKREAKKNKKEKYVITPMSEN